MAELITALVALPLLYLIGEFYGRLGAWCWRALATAVRAGLTPGEPAPAKAGGGRDHAGR